MAPGERKEQQGEGKKKSDFFFQRLRSSSAKRRSISHSNNLHLPKITLQHLICLAVRAKTLSRHLKPLPPTQVLVIKSPSEVSGAFFQGEQALYSYHTRLSTSVSSARASFTLAAGPPPHPPQPLTGHSFSTARENTVCSCIPRGAGHLTQGNILYFSSSPANRHS